MSKSIWKLKSLCPLLLFTLSERLYSHYSFNQVYLHSLIRIQEKSVGTKRLKWQKSDTFRLSFWTVFSQYRNVTKTSFKVDYIVYHWYNRSILRASRIAFSPPKSTYIPLRSFAESVAVVEQIPKKDEKKEKKKEKKKNNVVVLLMKSDI